MGRPIPERESLTVEFKSDRERLPDQELVETAICLANAEGGQIYVGVENDGRVTGLHPVHDSVDGLSALIANRTVPSLSVQVTKLDVDGRAVARIDVPKSRAVVATSDGVVQRRRLLADGTPACVPMYPHEIEGRQSDLGLLDYSARPIETAGTVDFDPLERQRLREVIQQYRGDRALLGLAQDEIERALGLTRRVNGEDVPTVAGLLLLGREGVLRDVLPTHEIAFQVLDGTEVRLNEFMHGPLLRMLDRVLEHFKARNEEREVQVGLFRVPVPLYEPAMFREAFMNAVIHRDYTRLGAIHVRWLPDCVEISNPGGFVEGVTLENLLVTEPRPRNPREVDPSVKTLYGGFLSHCTLPPVDPLCCG